MGDHIFHITFLLALMTSLWTLGSTKPLYQVCTDGGPFDLLGMSIAQSPKMNVGAHVVKENGKKGYRFDSNSKLLGIPSSKVMTKCNFFPSEFSVIFSFKKELMRNENEYLLSLVGTGSHSILLDFHIQRDRLVFYYKSKKRTKSVSFRDKRLVDGKWHTVIVVIAGEMATFIIDCLEQSTSVTSFTLPKRIKTKGTRIYVGNRKSSRNRFTGTLGQVQLIPGSNATISLCVENQRYQANLVQSEVVNGSTFHKVMFIDEETYKGDSMMKEGCNKETQGLLMYHQQKGNLEMCQNRSWKPLARVQEKLDYVVDAGSLSNQKQNPRHRSLPDPG